MDLFILSFTCLVNLLLGIVIFLRDSRSGAARMFLLMSILINMWIIANYVTNHIYTGDLTINDIANKLTYISGVGVILSGLAFSYYFPRRRRISFIEIISIIVASAVTIALSATDAIAGVVSINAGQGDELVYQNGPYTWVYLVVFVGLLLMIAKNLLYLPGVKDTMQIFQARIVLIAFSVSAIFGLVLNVVLPLLGFGWHTTRFGPLVTIILVGMIAYTIVRHRLFDIRLAVVRTIVYGCVLLTLSSVYYLLAYLVSILLFGGQAAQSVSVGPVNIVMALLLAFLFQPVKRFFDRTTDTIFYRHQYKSDEFFESVSSVLVSTTDLHSLLTRAATQIGTTLKTDQSFFYVYYGGNLHMSAGMGRHSKVPISDARVLNSYFDGLGKKIIQTSLMSRDDHAYRLLISHKIEITMALRTHDQTVGYLFLGESKSNGYSKTDMRVLETISNELVIAIQNALSLQEVKEINATLQQRIENATLELRQSNDQLRHLDEVKDEFVSMASHQLRTPLTSVKGYISMVIEGDVGKITTQQRMLLEEAFSSSERMVRLISDFLNVSRLQTGKFILDKHVLDLAQVVQQEVDSLKVIAHTHDLKLTYVKPSGIPKLNLDEGKIRQVIMNFIDNAVYYSRANSTITVTLEQTSKEVIFVVQDTGIGVPKIEQTKLFAKFFRATNARKQRPDGTGVGLFLAKKVITAHDGAMVFSSIEGEGSRFGFRLPIAKNIAPEVIDVTVD